MILDRELIVPMANANDGGGSIRTPASNCGLVGLKPSRGRVPSGPQLADIWFGLIGEHAVTRSVRDSAALLDASCGDFAQQLVRLPPPTRPYLDEAAREPGRLRIAWSLDRGLGRHLHPENRAALEQAVKLLTSLGHTMIEVRLPLEAEAFVGAYAMLVAAEVAAMLRRAPELVGRSARRADLELRTWLLARIGEAHSAGEVTAAWQSLQLFARRWLAWSSTFDVLLTPTVGLPPLPIGAYDLRNVERRVMSALASVPGGVLRRQQARIVEAFQPVFDAAPYTMIANVTGQPSVSLPLHWTSDELPMGLMFTTALGDEATLFRLAAQLERAQPWADRAPSMAWQAVPNLA